jgi:hypothetical protein
MATEIAKVQRPLNVQGGPWLIYGRGRTNFTTIEQDELPEHVQKALAKYPKGYFKAHWSASEGWALSDQVAEQGW